jgi:hypothetical protein
MWLKAPCVATHLRIDGYCRGAAPWSILSLGLESVRAETCCRHGAGRPSGGLFPFLGMSIDVTEACQMRRWIQKLVVVLAIGYVLFFYLDGGIALLYGQPSRSRTLGCSLGT